MPSYSIDILFEIGKGKYFRHDLTTLQHTKLYTTLSHTLTCKVRSTLLTSMSGLGRYFDASSLLLDATGSLFRISLLIAFSLACISFWIWYCCFLSIGRICNGNHNVKCLTHIILYKHTHVTLEDRHIKGWNQTFSKNNRISTTLRTTGWSSIDNPLAFRNK